MLDLRKDFYSKELFVNSYHTDLKGKLSIPSLFSFFQEIAWEHASLHGFGYEHLKEQGFFWALSRFHLTIDKLPNWTDRLKLITWPSGIDGIFALRDFEIYDMNGNKLIGATSSWLIVDTNTRRPRRPDVFKEKMPICDTIRSTEMNGQRIDNLEKEASTLFENVTRVSDIDVNGHTNNTKYVEWAINTFNEEDYRRIEVKEVNVNYLSEGFSGDVCVVASKEISQASRLISITRKSDSKSLALIEIK